MSLSKWTFKRHKKKFLFDECSYEKTPRNLEWFSPNKGFFELKIVWNTIIFISLFSIIIATCIAYNSNLKLDLSFNGWNNFITYFKVPLGVFALLIPLGAIYSSNHRSTQTLEQMKLTTKQMELAAEQNKFANYYKHLEEFERYCDTHSEFIHKAARRYLHGFIFPKATEGVYSVDGEFIQGLNDALAGYVANLRDKDWNEDLHEFITQYTEALLVTCGGDWDEELISGYVNSAKKIPSDRDDMKIKNMISYQLSRCYLSLAFKNLLISAHFDTSYQSPAFLRLLIQSKHPWTVLSKLNLTREEATKKLPYIRFNNESDMLPVDEEFFVDVSTEEVLELQSIEITSALNLNKMANDLNSKRLSSRL